MIKNKSFLNHICCKIISKLQHFFQDPETKQMKLNYNNIDILELEVPQNQQIVSFLSQF